MISTATPNKVTFNVNVFGTASTPTVRCVLGEAPAFSFPAVKQAADEYEVVIDLPRDMRVGAYPFKVEVLLNGRLFTPINHTVEVTGPVEAAPEAPAPNPVSDVAVPVAPASEVVVSTEPQHQIELVTRVEKIDAVKPTPTPEATEVAPVGAIAALPKATLGTLETLSKQPVFKKLTPARESVAVKATMMSINQLATELEKPKAPKAVSKPSAPVIESMSPHVPVSIVKGKIVFK